MLAVAFVIISACLEITRGAQDTSDPRDINRIILFCMVLFAEEADLFDAVLRHLWWKGAKRVVLRSGFHCLFESCVYSARERARDDRRVYYAVLDLNRLRLTWAWQAVRILAHFLPPTFSTMIEIGITAPLVQRVYRKNASPKHKWYLTTASACRLL